MIDKKELKVLTKEVANDIYKNVVSMDYGNKHLAQINQMLAPLVQIIKQQQRQFDELKRFVDNRHKYHKEKSAAIEDIHGDDPCSKYNYHDGYRAGKSAGKENAYETVKGAMKK
jgi:hypothetical protein